MIPQQAEKSTTKRSNEFKSKQMSVAPEQACKLIWLTINQYKYKIRTSVQELISNAIDAQVEAGNKNTPLEIQLPTRLEPTFKLRDFGTGMTPDVIDRIYTNMGASGSSHTNEKKGGFGIGGKSPLGFTSSYSIRTIVDGRYWIYAVSGTQGNPIDVDLMTSGETNEPNGTEVIIPAKPDQIGEFKKAACRATMFWDVQPKFNFTKEELFTANNPLKLSDEISIYKNIDLANMFSSDYYRAGAIVLIDGIPYELDYEMCRKYLKKSLAYLNRDSMLIINAKVSDFVPLQTREALEQKEVNYNRLKEFDAKASQLLENHLKSEANKTTLMETWDAYNTLRERFSNVPTITFSNDFKINYRDIHWERHEKTKNDEGLDIEKEVLGGISLIGYTYQSKNSRYYINKSARRLTEYTTSLNPNALNNIYWDDLGDAESEVLKGRRLKHKAEGTTDELYRIDPDMTPELRELLLKHFNFPKLSSLPLPPKQAKKAAKSVKKLGTGKVDVHVIAIVGGRASRSWYCREVPTREVNTIDLSTNNKKFLWTDYSYYHADALSSEWKDYAEQQGYKVCLVAKKYQKDIKANKNFFSFEEWRKNVKPTERQVNGILLDRVFDEYYRSDNNYKKLMVLALKTSDKLLTRYAKTCILDRENTSTLPQSIIDQVVEENESRIKAIDAARSRFIKRLETKYPLALMVEEAGQEVISYINALNRK